MQPGGPRSPASDTTLFGVYYAVVTQNKDEELSLGRIKVRFPWLDQGDTDQAHWAQLSTPMEGDKYGWYTLPDVGDLVVVMFIAGDIRQPVVLGGVWNKTDTPPEDNANGKNDFRGYRSRAGHRLILDDSSNAKVVLVDKTNKNVVAVGPFGKGGDGPNATEPPKPGGAGSAGVTISSMEGKVQVNCPKGTLKVSGQAIKLNAKTAIEIKSTKAMTIEGQGTGAVSSTGPGKLDGSSTKIN